MGELISGQWCDKEKIDCFNIIVDNGLIIYETTTGDFRSGRDNNYDKKGIIIWD